jgi:AraC family transcriptional regulator
MSGFYDILTIAHKQPIMEGELELLAEKEKQIQGTWKYAIRRYRRHPQWNAEDSGMFVYHVQENDSSRNYMELRFCVLGNAYCRDKNMDSDSCRIQESTVCEHKVPTVDVLHFRFEHAHLSQFVKGMKTVTKTDDVLNFRHTASFSRMLSLCGRMRTAIDALLNHNYTDSL